MNVWHGRLSHPNKSVLQQVLSKIHDQVSVNATPEFCEACEYGKLHQNGFSSTHSLHTTGPFQVIHMDVWGLAPYISIEGYRFYIAFVDDLTRCTRIYPLKIDDFAIEKHYWSNKWRCLKASFHGLDNLPVECGIHLIYTQDIPKGAGTNIDDAHRIWTTIN